MTEERNYKLTEAIIGTSTSVFVSAFWGEWLLKPEEIFANVSAPTEVYTRSLHVELPIYRVIEIFTTPGLEKTVQIGSQHISRSVASSLHNLWKIEKMPIFWSNTCNFGTYPENKGLSSLITCLT